MSMMQLLAGSLQQDGGEDPADAILATALVNLQPSGISGTGATTAWENAGLGGSDYDLVASSVTTDLSTTTINGKTVVQNANAGALRPASGQIITPNMTIMIATRSTGSAIPRGLLDSRDSGTNRIFMQTLEGTFKFSVFAGTTNITLSEAYDTDPHVWTFQHLSGASSNLTVDGVGTVTGNPGSGSLNYCSLFQYYGDNSYPWVGWIGAMAIWDDGGISDSDAALVATKWNSDFGI